MDRHRVPRCEGRRRGSATVPLPPDDPDRPTGPGPDLGVAHREELVRLRETVRVFESTSAHNEMIAEQFRQLGRSRLFPSPSCCSRPTTSRKGSCAGAWAGSRWTRQSRTLDPRGRARRPRRPRRGLLPRSRSHWSRGCASSRTASRCSCADTPRQAPRHSSKRTPTRSGTRALRSSTTSCDGVSRCA